jgi:hypothetical protein
MTDRERLLDELRPVAFAIAYRMLGSVSETAQAPAPRAAGPACPPRGPAQPLTPAGGSSWALSASPS